jgi:hypothetical protein
MMPANTNTAHIRQIADLESALQQLILEHRKLLKHIDAQQAAMKALNLRAMDEATNQQEAARLRIATLEHKRRTLTLQIAKLCRLNGEPKIPQLADLFPHRKTSLLKLRQELLDVIGQIAARNHIAGKLAGAVLGHLNTAVRLLAGAVEHAGLYTKHGVPRMSARIGVMEAVG